MALTQKSIYTVIDANVNRAKEGIRVIEDIIRFIFSNKKATRELKDLRHGIDSAIKKISPDYKIMIAGRDSNSDVGRKINTKSEFKRQDLTEILISNFKRVEESLRVMEEISKLMDKKAAEEFKDMRYKTYVIERKILLNGKTR